MFPNTEYWGGCGRGPLKGSCSQGLQQATDGPAAVHGAAGNAIIPIRSRGDVKQRGLVANQRSQSFTSKNQLRG